MDKFGWNEETFDSIDWNAMRAYTRNLEGTKETNLIKLVMDRQNDNHQNNLFYGKSGKCPACALEDKNHFHFI